MNTYNWNQNNVIAEPLDGERYKITDKISGGTCYADTEHDALIIGNLIALGQVEYER